MKQCEESDAIFIRNDISDNDNDYDNSTSESESELPAGPSQRSQIIQPVCNYVAEAQSIIKSTTHPPSNTQHALAVNKRLQDYLKILKQNLENLLEKCRQKYKHNEEVHQRIRNKSDKLRLGRQHSYFLCGYPFFKDEGLFSAPPNEHYLKRKKSLGELFPMDIRDYTINWTTKDKMFLIQGVKSQIIDAIASKNRDNARATIKCTRVGGLQKKLDVALRNKSLEKLMLSDLYDMLMNQNIQFKIDWFTISTEKLDDRHPPKQCMALWNAYLKPTLNRNRWTTDEEEKLHQIVQNYNYQNWPKIAKHLPGRSGYQCFVHYQSVMALMNIQRNVRFTPEEDNLLMQTIEKHRIGSIIPWSTIVEKMPGRTKTQVYNRYMWSIKPGIKKDKFSVEEDCKLTAAVKEYGTNFHKFPRDLLPGRTLVQIRNRYNNVLKFVGENKPWSSISDKQLMEFHEKYSSKNWAKIAEEMTNWAKNVDEMKIFSRFSCRSRYLTITRYLEKYPDRTIDDVPTKNFSSRTSVTADNWMETIIRVKQAQQHGVNLAQKPVLSGNIPALTLDVYQYFKYSYRYKFKPICLPTKLTTDTTHVAGQLLQHKLCPKDFKILIEPSGGTVDMQHNTFSDCIPNNYVFPPSWCTAQLFRGLEIMFSDDKISGALSSSTSKTETTDDTELNELHVILRQRLFSLLYSTIICSSLELPSIESCNDNDDANDDNNANDDNIYEEYIISNEIEESISYDDNNEYGDSSVIEIDDYKISPNEMLLLHNNDVNSRNLVDNQKPCTSKQAKIVSSQWDTNSQQIISYELKPNSNNGDFKISLVNNEQKPSTIVKYDVQNISELKRSLSPQNIDLDKKSKRIKKATVKKKNVKNKISKCNEKK